MDVFEEATPSSPPPPPTPFTLALLSGGMAGTMVDVVLFPLDTIKTRLQSAAGFRASGGASNLYSGLGPVLAGSAPGAAVFFCTYETCKSLARDPTSPYAHMASASAGEVAACVVRVPVEVIKQRRQADPKGPPPSKLFKTVLDAEGFRGLYRGYVTTVLREIPFSLIQFPLWEWLKAKVAREGGKSEAAPWQSALCGAAAGGVSAAATTPLDVAKTRIMLAKPGTEEASRASLTFTLSKVLREEGVRACFSGVGPRVAWISVGGMIFFGVYEGAKLVLRDWCPGT